MMIDWASTTKLAEMIKYTNCTSAEELDLFQWEHLFAMGGHL